MSKPRSYSGSQRSRCVNIFDHEYSYHSLSAGSSSTYDDFDDDSRGVYLGECFDEEKSVDDVRSRLLHRSPRLDVHYTYSYGDSHVHDDQQQTTGSHKQLGLPLKLDWNYSKKRRRRRCGMGATPKRVFQTLLSGLFLLVLFILSHGIPPSYQEFRKYEMELLASAGSINWRSNWRWNLREVDSGIRSGWKGHHDGDADEEERYLWYPEHVWGHGWNNFLQEAILIAQLAHLTNRSYVFEDYTWSHLPLPWTLYDWGLRPTKLPLSAWLSGSMILGVPPPADASDSSTIANADVRRNVPLQFYKHRCPKSQVVTIDASGAPKALMDGKDLMQWWVDKLNTVKDIKCVELDMGEEMKFSVSLFGSPRIQSLVPSLLSSPILQSFAWSPLILSAVTRNSGILKPALSFSSHSVQAPLAAPPLPSNPSPKTKASYEPSSPHSYGAPPTAYNPTFPNLVAVHLRRGDYIRHCPRLASYGSMYMGINRLPGLEDRFRPWLAEDDGDEDDSGHTHQRHPHQQNKEGNKSENSLVRDGQMKQNVTDLDFENWTPLTADTSVVSKEAVERYYERHCFPSVTQIVKKLQGVREGYERQHSISGLVHQTGNVVHKASSGSTTTPSPPAGAATKHILSRLFLLTNASPSSSFLIELKASLVKDGWEGVVTTSELELDWKQEHVRMGVDMVVATGAEVFVGNGFSSGSSNTVLLRTAAGAPMHTNHFL